MDQIIVAVTSCARKTSQKYGISVPQDLCHAKKLDAINGNPLWQEAIEVDMANFRVDFEILEPNKYAAIGWKASRAHLM